MPTLSRGCEHFRPISSERTQSSDHVAYPTYSGPLLDGQIIAAAPAHLYAAGKGAQVPVMIGATSKDIGFMQAAKLDALYAAVWSGCRPGSGTIRKIRPRMSARSPFEPAVIR